MSAERLEVANRKTPIPFLVGRFHKRDRDGNPYYDVKSAVLRVLESPWPWKCAWRADDLPTMPVREPESAAAAVSEKSTEEL